VPELLNITGFKELDAALKELPDRIARNVLRGAVNAAATVIRKEAVAHVAVDTGTLKRAIYQKQIREKSDDQHQTFYVGVRAGKQYQQVKRGKNTVSLDAFYAKWVEYGHVAPNGVLIPAHPFMRTAFVLKRDEAIETMRQYLAERIEREAATLGTFLR
jgi:HK97 gp10 family phage protein